MNRMAWSLIKCALSFSVTLAGIHRHIVAGCLAPKHVFLSSSFEQDGLVAIQMCPSLLCDPQRDPPWQSGYMPGSQACAPKFFISRIAWSLYECAAFWSSVYGVYATERHLRTICKEMEISPSFQSH